MITIAVVFAVPVLSANLPWVPRDFLTQSRRVEPRRRGIDQFLPCHGHLPIPIIILSLKPSTFPSNWLIVHLFTRCRCCLDGQPSWGCRCCFSLGRRAIRMAFNVEVRIICRRLGRRRRSRLNTSTKDCNCFRTSSNWFHGRTAYGYRSPRCRSHLSRHIGNRRCRR